MVIVDVRLIEQRPYFLGIVPDPLGSLKDFLTDKREGCSSVGYYARKHTYARQSVMLYCWGIVVL